MRRSNALATEIDWLHEKASLLCCIVYCFRFAMTPKIVASYYLFFFIRAYSSILVNLHNEHFKQLNEESNEREKDACLRAWFPRHITTKTTTATITELKRKRTKAWNVSDRKLTLKSTFTFPRVMLAYDCFFGSVLCCIVFCWLFFPRIVFNSFVRLSFSCLHINISIYPFIHCVWLHLITAVCYISFKTNDCHFMACYPPTHIHTYILWSWVFLMTIDPYTESYRTGQNQLKLSSHIGTLICANIYTSFATILKKHSHWFSLNV